MPLPSFFRIAVVFSGLSFAGLASTQAGFLDSVKGWFSSGSKPAPAVIKTAVASPWTDNYENALARAKAEKKNILLDVTGSTWCPLCQALEKEVFTTKTFKDYAEKKLVLLRLDFPEPVLDIDQKTQWALKYFPKESSVGLPLIVMIAPDGHALGTTTYGPGGPDPFIADVEKLVRK